MRYRTIGGDAATQRSVSVLSLGAMLMGSRTDEATSFAILDWFVEAGGTFIDTSGNYAFWVPGACKTAASAGLLGLREWPVLAHGVMQPRSARGRWRLRRTSFAPMAR